MDPRRLALWRYERIEELLGDDLSTAQRRALLLKLSKAPVCWPGGAERRISEATLYRWLRAYRKGGLEGLQPKAASARKAIERTALPREALEYAIALLREEPERSLTMLLRLLEAEKGIVVSRSSLHRHLASHPAYPRLRRLRSRKGLRRRFQAREPHDIWQCDSKGPFTVRFSGSVKEQRVHIFSILDDFSRAVLAYRCVDKADLAAAVLVFRQAAARWGLPRRFYADRASVFDSEAFRSGLATLGVHRIRSRPRNAPARGKIEAYHRPLGSWFVRELRHQLVLDLEHLNRLLGGVIEGVYMKHPHRHFRKSPQELLSGRLSSRQVSLDRLADVFLQRVRKRSHPRSGEVELGRILFRVEEELAGKRLSFAHDPVDPQVAFVELPGGRKRLKPALEAPPRAAKEPRAVGGHLQALYDHWQGRKLPQAEAGFGLPELFELFSQHLERRVPQDEFEARSLEDFYRKHGPLGRTALEPTLKKIFRRLGSSRPLLVYLEALREEITPP